MSSAKVDLQGAMDLIKRSKYLLAPLFEGITNSLEALSSKEFTKGESGRIEINLYFSGLLNEAKALDKIEIIDNGEGFTETSFERFNTLLDKSKGYKNRGTGRIQYLHRFEKVDVVSTYKNGDSIFKREFYFDNRNFVTPVKNEPDDEAKELETKVSFINLKKDKNETAFWDKLTILDVKNELTKKFLLKLYLEQQKKPENAPIITIRLFKNASLLDEVKIDSKEIPAPQDKGEFAVSYKKIKDHTLNDIAWLPVENKNEKFEWAYFKLPEAELDKNGIYLCSKDVAVQELPLLRNKLKRNENIAGFRHLTAVYSNVLDEGSSVNDAVDRFTLPYQKDIEKEAKEELFFEADKLYLLMDDIEKEVKKIIPQIYEDIDILLDEQKSQVIAIARAHGIPEEIAKATNIDLTDTEDKITEKIYKKQAEYLAEKNLKIKRVFEGLTTLNPTSKTYQHELSEKGSELLNLIPEQNKQELSRYIIRREMITEILRLIIKNALQYQTSTKGKGEKRDKEGLIHDLIFKRKSLTTDTLNDLWILSEEYMHYAGCSELPLNQIEIAPGKKLLKPFDSEDALLNRFGINRFIRRPDIFLFIEERKCILIELKNNNVDLSNHVMQLTKYCNLIANCAVNKIDQFYCYLIGEEIDRVDLPAEFEETAYGDLVRVYQPIRSAEQGKEYMLVGSIYQEVIKLSAIHKRAAIRNKSFADKLGIRVDTSSQTNTSS